jgi:pimeloyl-ACP methyl ester carboxylesterase
MSTQALMLVPGLMCDHAVWDPVIPRLAGQADCRVVDHGRASSLVTMAEQVLSAAPARFALAGHSMGARVALEVVRRAPQRVTRLALLDSGHRPRAAGEAGEEEVRKRHALLAIARAQGVRAMAAEWVKGMVAPARLGDAALIGAVLDMFDRKDADHFAAQIEALIARADLSPVLQSLSVPTLILCGREDGWAPVTQHEAMRSLAPRAHLVVVEGAGHMAPMETPQAVAAALADWLALEV